MPEVAPVEIFGALADESRWQILVRLGTEPASASTLATELPISRQAIAKHLKILTDAGLVTATRAGREIRYEAAGSELSRLARHLDTVARGWDRRLAGIKKAAERD
ncbi:MULTISPECIES: ArsR/SmtB family transcription factor [Gordonia]|uniref:ArsR family transcriptional regulator n=1 Tax=Gordonia alkanivorans CGMCC 6845 TaxID=1423140 RepID=W9DL54_9ACTN|nr:MULTISPECIES: metalloregulator ArsR/SmtB family transcription factor [Gordonia]ETA07745.1 ArsR family transcriptional regulator [Gordonia alkanivorans CGMCC 6845]MDH3007607.1 metalloregulator ArsR/SmtB family transcription factor [Gordonia alkanivorans]MDH3015208.1 metalloregulator ArsR/SmtB family transcription factor [Gordonia alkanivorans]MDH3024263.1 metalloregulator ArsR/SmtB family transcription factor [Gordonia alkanivorans]MDH3039982.1 metalloregulator ArsR/SmtB family transcription